MTIRFETRETPAGPVRSFRADDPALTAWVEPEPEGGADQPAAADPD